MDQLTYKRGLLSDLRRQKRTIEIEIDSAVKSQIYHYDPLDADFGYIDNINPEMIQVYTDIITRKKAAYVKITTRIKQLEKETGESE